MNGPRHTTIDADPRSAALQNGENARDTLEALSFRPIQRAVTVPRYTAAGSTSTRIRIGAGERPLFVQLARACLAGAEDAALPAYGTPNFVWESTTKSIDVFEPTGLTANSVYLLQFLITEAQ